MPGICGIIGSRVAPRLFDEMRLRMKHADWFRDESYVDEASGLFLGRVTLGFVNAAPQPARCGDTGSLAVMDGELYREADVRARLARLGRIAGESQADLLLQGYLAEGPRFFRDLDGKFTVALWDAGKKRLLLVNDRMGMKPVYYAKQPGRFLFASEIKSLLADAEVPRATNPRGIIQFFTFGHLWNNETLYESIRTLGPAQILEFAPERDEVHKHTYWSLNDVSPEEYRPAEILDRVDHRLKSHVDALSKETEGLGLALSGGLDARTILGLIDHRTVRMRCISLGIKGSLDQQSARELASLAGVPFHPYALAEDFKAEFTRHLNRMVQLTDGHYLSQCIVMPTLPLYRALGIRVLLRGHAGELMHMTKAYNFSLDDEGQQLRGTQELEQWLFKKLRAYMLDAVDGPLFDFSTAAEAESVARESLSEALTDTKNWASPTNRIAQLFIAQRMRRETAMSLVKFNSVVETRLPYVDPELVQLLLCVPPSMRLQDTIQSHILRRRAPDFLKPANSNTGAPIGAGWLSKKWSYAKLRVLAKLGVRGYQPYERLGLWLRRELRDQVRAILLDEACLERGILRADAVRRIVEQHLTNQRNHTFLLLAMMTYELGQRKWNDGPRAVSSQATLSSVEAN